MKTRLTAMPIAENKPNLRTVRTSLISGDNKPSDVVKHENAATGPRCSAASV